MSIFFQFPALAWLLPLIGVPVLCHLLARARPPVYRFSSVEFLQRVVRRTSRLRRPADRMLLALRTLAMLALLLVFPGLLLLSKDAPLPGSQRTTVFLIDRSGSMAAIEGAGSRFQAACAAAAEWMDATGPDLTNVIWLDHAPAAVFPDPGPNRAFLSELLAKATVKPEPGALTAAFDLAWRQLSGARGVRELIVISDFQDSAWRDFQTAVPPGVTVRTVPVATAAPANVAVVSLVAVPASPVAGQAVTLLAKAANHSAEPRRTTLTIDAGGARQSRVLELPPNGEAETAISLKPGAGGPLPVTAELEADAFPSDDRAHTVIDVRESLRLAIGAAAEHPVAAVLTTLAGALPWMEAVTADPARPPDCDIWFLPDWNGSDAAGLRSLTERGVTVCVQPAAGIGAEAVAAVLGLADKQPAQALAAATSPDSWEVSRLAEHPAFALFRDGAFGHPFAGKFRERLTLPESFRTAPGLTMLASWRDEAPAVLMAAGKGTAAPVILFTLPFDPAKTDWPARSVFVPAMAELLLRTRPDAGAGDFLTTPGALPVWHAGDVPRTGSPELVAPDGSVVPLTSASGPGGESWQAAAPAVPGLYRWQISGQPVHYTACTFPPSESNLRPASTPPAFDGAAATGREDLARQAALDRGLPLWPWLAAAALAFLLIEGILTARRPRTAPAS